MTGMSERKRHLGRALRQAAEDDAIAASYPRRVVALIHGTSEYGGCTEVEVGGLAMRPARSLDLGRVSGSRAHIHHTTILVRVDGETMPRRIGAERVEDVQPSRVVGSHALAATAHKKVGDA